MHPGLYPERGRLDRPHRARVCGLQPKAFLLFPFPGPVLVGLASPGGSGSGPGRPWRLPPGALGVPSVLFFSPLFFRCFRFCFVEGSRCKVWFWRKVKAELPGGLAQALERQTLSTKRSVCLPLQPKNCEKLRYTSAHLRQDLKRK